MPKDIVVTNPRLLKVLEWFEDQSMLVKSFFLAVVRFTLITLIGAAGFGVYLMAGPNAVGAYITFLGVWGVSYLRIKDMGQE